MEYNRSKCLSCTREYSWVGFKTGLGKTDAQLLEMSHKDHTCNYCKSKALVTGLDFSDEESRQNQNYRADPTIITSWEAKRFEEDFKQYLTQYFKDKCCGCEDFVTISMWIDTDGKFMLLYCKKCHKRFAVEVDGDYIQWLRNVMGLGELADKLEEWTVRNYPYR